MVSKLIEKSRPSTRKFDCDHFKLMFGHKIWSENFLLPTHTAFVFDLLIFNPDTL